MSVSYGSTGSISYSTGNPAPTYPSGISAGDLLVLVVGTKPGGAAADTPTDWTALGGFDSTTGTTGIDTGPMRVGLFYKVADGTESGSLTVTIPSNNVSAASIYRWTNATGYWDLAATFGEDTSGGTSWSALCDSAGSYSFQNGDHVLFGGIIPTDVTTPSQFSAQAVTSSTASFATATEIEEWDTSSGRDMGAFIARTNVTSSGNSTSAPTVTATAGGTTTNVYGPSFVLRIRESSPPAQTLVISGVASGEAVGTPDILQDGVTQTLVISGIASGEAVGTPVVVAGAITTIPGGVASGEALGTPVVVAGAITTIPGGIADTGGVGTPSLTQEQFLGLGNIASGEAVPTPVVTQQQILVLTGVADDSGVGDPRIALPVEFSSRTVFPLNRITSSFPQTLTPGGVASGEALGTPVLSTTVSLTATGIADTGGLGTPVTSSVARVIPGGVASGEAVAAPALQGVARVQPGGVGTSEAAPSPNLTASATVVPDGVASGETVPAPNISLGGFLVPTAIPSGETLGTPTIVTGPVTAILPGIASGQAFTSPVLRPNTTIVPPGVASAGAFTSPAVSTTVTVVPGGIASAGAVGTPVTGAPTRLVMPGIAGEETVTDPEVTTPAVLDVASLPDDSAVGEPTITVSAITLTVDGVASAAATAAPRIILNATIAPPSPTPTTGVGTPVVGQIARLIFDGIATAEAVPSPFIIGPQALVLTGISDGAVGTPNVIGPQYLSPPGIGISLSEYWGALV